VKDSSMWHLDCTQWKAQVCFDYILLIERLKDVSIRFYSLKGSSMLQLDLTQRKAQICDY
jgi:hypothetical protein